MGAVYAIANQKGGVGKTTTAVNVAASIAEAGHQTLLADLDPQCNATVALGLPKDLSPSTYDCLSGGPSLEEAAVDTAFEGLRAVPATPDLAGASVELRAQRGLGDPAARRHGRHPRALPVHDPRLPAGAGPAHRERAGGGRPVIVPVQTEYFALEGLAGLLDTLSLVQRELNPHLTVAGMILTMHDGRTRLARDVEKEVREHFPELVFDTVIPRNVRVGEAPSFGRPGHPARAGQRRVGRLPQAGQGDGRPCLSRTGAAWAGAVGDPARGRRATSRACATIAGRADRPEPPPAPPPLRRGGARRAVGVDPRARAAAADSGPPDRRRRPTSWWPASAGCGPPGIAELETVPALVRDTEDGERLELALAENMAREDLNPVEEARACATLVEDLGLTKEDVGRRVGRSRVAVSNLIRLLDLPDEVLELVESGEPERGPRPGAAHLPRPRRAAAAWPSPPATRAGRCARPSAAPARPAGEPRHGERTRWCSTPTWPRRWPPRRTP